MKPAVYILSFAVAILIFLFLRERNVNANSKDYIKQKQEEIETIHRERDSLSHVVSMALDAMDAKDEEITRAHEEVQKSQIKAEKLRIKYENIKFVTYPNDSARMRILSELYNSYKNP